jgi:hypothetical protein
MAKCRRPLPVQSQRIVQLMTRDLRDRMGVYHWTHSALADRLGWERSRISHALARGGEELPPKRLIQSIANALDAQATVQGRPLPPLTERTMRLWQQAHQISSIAQKRERLERRRTTANLIEGAPPAMETYRDLLHALNDLVVARFGSQRAMCRAWRLKRQTVNAALSDRRSLRLDLMVSILQVCGVRGGDLEAWQAAWRRLAEPRQQAALERQRAGYDLVRQAQKLRSRSRSW